MISTRKKFVFVHIPKTAGNSIQLAISPYCDDRLVYNPRQARYNHETGGTHRFGIESVVGKLPKHARLQEIRKSWDVGDLGPWESYYKFTCVRNPWDRMVSFYFSPHLGRATFDRTDFRAFLTEFADRKQAGYVTLGDTVGVDFAIRFENLAEDFAAVCDRLGISADLPHVNQSQRTGYRDYYDEDTRALVEDLYAEDIALFSYRFDG